jgi:Domain of unknown function (DUF4252)
MNRAVRMLLRILAGVALCCVAMHAQTQGARLQLANLDKLGDKAVHVTDVTLDGPLLEMAAKFISFDEDQEDADLVAIMKGLKGIYVKSFEFDAANQYSQADVEAIRKQLAGPGWARIVTDINKRTGEKNEIYLLKEGKKVAGVAILVAEARELTIVNIVGAVPMDKIAKFQEHFAHGDSHGSKPKKDKESSNEKK